MNIQKNNSALLPAGLEDLLPPQAEGEYEAIARLMSVFKAFGYERVKPPIAEFEESMLALGPGAALAADTFRVMDPLSHRMMALRSDITAQIARIARSRLADQARPLRVTYANDVLRTRASQQRTQRQFTQVGCEMVGLDDVRSDIEVAVLAVLALQEIGMRDVTIDFSLPRIYDAVFEKAGVDKQEKDILRSKLAGESSTVLAALKGLNFDEAAAAEVSRLEQVVGGLKEALVQFGVEGVNVTVDPLENRGFEYHCGVVFTLFSKGVRGELGRGGRYDIYEGADAVETASGFTFYMDTIRHGLEFVPQVKRIAVRFGDMAAVKELQAEGWVTIMGEPDENSTHKYEQGQIKEL